MSGFISAGLTTRRGSRGGTLGGAKPVKSNRGARAVKLDRGGPTNTPELKQGPGLLPRLTPRSHLVAAGAGDRPDSLLKVVQGAKVTVD